jgi:preprotein translocase subunit YajC
MELNMMMNFVLAAAETAPGLAPHPKAQLLQTVGFAVVMLFLFYFAFIRPQSKKAKEHAALLKSLKPGDRVVTSGGIVAVVITVKEKTVSLRSAESKMEVLKTAVAEIIEREGEGAQA